MQKQELRERVEHYIRETDMLAAGDRVLAAVSGGADSVCLLHVLLQAERYQTAPRWQVRAMHVHHGLRGEEADRDEQFVRSLCGRWQVPLTVVYRDVKACAAECGLSEEEAGRILRYQALEEAAGEWEKECGTEPCRVRIALAHHMDDNAETIFHHLLRGSGLRGLAGIRPVQGRRIRPLLCVRSSEIRAYLTAQEISWCEDSTNGSLQYTRNRIRHEIFPMLTELVNARAVENLLHAGELFAQADAYLERQAAAVFDLAGIVKSDGPTGEVQAAVRLEEFREQEPIIRSYVLRRMLDLTAPEQKDITARHYSQLEQLAGLPPGSRCDLPGRLGARRDYDFLWIGRGASEAGRTKQAVPDKNLSDIVKLCTFSHQKDAEIPKNRYTKWFDYDKIKGTLSVRTRQRGDYLTLAGGGHKSLNRYMIDEKIPKEARDKIPLLAEGHHILWVAGYRISEYYKITEETQMILQAEINGGEIDGRQNSGTIVGRGSGQQNQ